MHCGKIAICGINDTVGEILDRAAPLFGAAVDCFRPMADRRSWSAARRSTGPDQLAIRCRAAKPEPAMSGDKAPNRRRASIALKRSGNAADLPITLLH